MGFCDYDATVERNRGTFQWNETGVNRTASTLCTYGPAGQTATRLCAVRDTWAVPSVDKCGTVVSEQFTMIQKVMSKLYRYRLIGVNLSKPKLRPSRSYLCTSMYCMSFRKSPAF